MIGFDDPSFDGEWNKEEKTQCWFSPCELYDRYNRVNDVAYSGFDWMYTNDPSPAGSVKAKSLSRMSSISMRTSVSIVKNALSCFSMKPMVSFPSVGTPIHPTWLRRKTPSRTSFWRRWSAWTGSSLLPPTPTGQRTGRFPIRLRSTGATAE